jgi:tRNA1Val (adenine37-N6)-methyltransferase
MSNSYFHFKQFTVHQDKCAMKVSTDACIQGAWTPIDDNVKAVLDIGTGTGLLSLMLAQRNSEMQIDAMELDNDAAAQAQKNISNTLWRDRINVIHADVLEYPFSKQYDMVICNPPFFQNSLLGPDDKRNNVRHTLSLTFDSLFDVIKKVLKPTGYASILLPVAEHAIWTDLANQQGWNISMELKIIPRHDLEANRVVSICLPQDLQKIEESIQIYQAIGEYTPAFRELMQPFYQKL